jgi:hypothetical protein
MKRSVLCAIAFVLLGTARAADEAPQQLSVTVYNRSLALVQDVRRLDVPKGRTKLEFKDVSASIKPETVSLAGKGLSVVEQNFDYDLLTPAKMMEKAVGRQIQIVRTNPATGKETPETATVLAVNDGVIVKIGNRIEALRDDGIPTRVVFSSIPENLRAQPTLSVTVEADNGGPREAVLSYLTTGLSWKADYVALFDEKQKAMTVQGWITLTNNSGTTYRDAKTQLVAGDINLTDDPQEYWQRHTATRDAGTSASGGTGIADYYAYPLPQRVTIAENQTKQVGFLDLAVKAAKAYEYRADDFSSDEQPRHVDSVVKFANEAHPLPAGVVRIYMRDDTGAPKFVGEDAIDHTPAGSALAVKLGEAFDVTVQATVVSSEKIEGHNTRDTMSYLLRNAQAVPADVELRQHGVWRDGKVENESQPSRRVDAGTLAWNVSVPAHGETTLTFTVDTGD